VVERPGDKFGTILDYIRAQEDQPYVWGSAGPPAEVEHLGVMVPIHQTVLDDVIPNLWDSFREMLRRDAIRRQAMRRLLAADPEGYARLQQLLRWAEAARQDREDREREARRCPTCGCDPLECHPEDY
jgi:hypothetical protein